MQSRRLGAQGLEVAEIGLGGMGMSELDRLFAHGAAAGGRYAPEHMKALDT